MRRGDPGPCLICDAAHCSCGGGPIEVVQLPNRDAAFIGVDRASGPDHSVLVTLGDGMDGRSFSAATYRGTKKTRGPAAAT